MATQAGTEALAQVLDVAERPRATGWSLRAALVRYAQPQPQRASHLLELVRRIEFALRRKDLGVDLLVGLVQALEELDRIGDVLSTWAVDAAVDGRPDAEIDATIDDVRARLEALGVEREERVRPTGARGRG